MQPMTIDEHSVGMSFWEFYQHALAMIKRIDPEFPEFDRHCFIELLVDVAESEWECLRPYIRGGRYDEHWNILSDRRRLWHWLFKTISWASYGAGLPIETGIFGLAVYKSNGVLCELPAPVPAKAEILGGPAIWLDFSDGEAMRLRQCEYLRIATFGIKGENQKH